MDGEVAWVVQVSDLHISAYHPERAHDLVRLLAPALRVIRPALLLITGDITDAKNRKRTSTRQDKSEWIQYRDSIKAIVSQSGIDPRAIFDIRGNHDKYGVPYVGDSLDFFSTHSVSSQFGRLNTIQSISLVGNHRKYLFLGIDDTMVTGIRGPSNLFGHPTDERIHAVESELQYWDMYPRTLATKVVFGHFPMSFTATSEKGKRYENVFARQSVSAYICGHLHARFSKQLWRSHRIELASNPKEPISLKQFWEWEIGDWRESRLIRILAVDGGKVSFLDLSLSSKRRSQEGFQITVLLTYPVDSRSMNGIEARSQMLRKDINALVFSAQPILNVTAKVFDSSRAFKIVEEIPLQLTTNLGNQKPLYHAKWNAENYRSTSATRYWLQVFVLDTTGKETASVMRPFSVDGNMANYPSTLMVHLLLSVRWEDLYSVLLWTNVGFLVLLLFLPMLLNYFMDSNPAYQRWAMSVSISRVVQQRRFLFSVLWFLIEGSRSRKLWSCTVIYLFYLLTLPWFCGRATSENGDIAKMYLLGWRLQARNSSITEESIGTPDVMVITLPFMYMVVTPSILLIYGLFAERSADFLRSRRKITSSDLSGFSTLEQQHKPNSVAEATLRSLKGKTMFLVCKICRGWTRRIILLSCLVVTCIQLKLCYKLMGFYGTEAALLSPAYWAPLFLLAAAIYSTV